MSAGKDAKLRLILASTSVYRKQLLERLGIPFTVAAPNIDESPLPGESAADLVGRLARTKAEVVARRSTHSLVIGSDQLAMCGRDVLGKPGSGDRAIAQLKSLSGHRVVFNTAVHVVISDAGTNEGHLDVTTVHFRRLSDDEIRRYVTRDKPYDSAGGFKVEALGISLFDKVDTHDPTALVGLPLIWLSAVLRKHGFNAP
ncbi:MAG TPA: nucleoside triphosphate pyrophosphatase [Steroidobacteraceae bacterium]|nr:nucleoside triphosphate pyrophosphatase [Steroidobacteraceae bacterium]